MVEKITLDLGYNIKFLAVIKQIWGDLILMKYLILDKLYFSAEHLECYFID